MSTLNEIANEVLEAMRDAGTSLSQQQYYELLLEVESLVAMEQEATLLFIKDQEDGRSS